LNKDLIFLPLSKLKTALESPAQAKMHLFPITKQIIAVAPEKSPTFSASFKKFESVSRKPLAKASLILEGNSFIDVILLNKLLCRYSAHFFPEFPSNKPKYEERGQLDCSKCPGLGELSKILTRVRFLCIDRPE
jgi:hypothetical protein